MRKITLLPLVLFNTQVSHLCALSKPKSWLLLLGYLFCTSIAQAYDVEIDEICYNIDYTNKTASVTAPNKILIDKAVDIPPTISIEGTSYDVTSIEDRAFSNTHITSISFHRRMTFGTHAFYNCSQLKAVYIDQLCDLCSSTFNGYEANPLYYAHNLYLKGELQTHLTFTPDVQSIKDYAFYGWEASKVVIIPPQNRNIIHLGKVNAFNTRIFVVNLSGSWLLKGASAKIYVLPKNLNWYNGDYYYQALFSENIGAVSATLQSNDDFIIKNIKTGTEEISVSNGTAHFFGLTSNKELSFTIYGELHGESIAVDYSVKPTIELELKTQPAQATSNNKALISAKTNGEDDALRFGFEWRRYDAPEEMPSSIVTCPVYEGEIAGTLNGLSATTYYKYRPFYKSDLGTVYYGDWIAFITADAYVYFEPVVHTYDVQSVQDNTATVSGTVVAGSENVIEQGFEYWQGQSNGVTRHAPQNVQTVQASGTVMSVTLTGLLSGTTYYYRTYVKTAKATTYGEERTFTTAVTTGIEEPMIADSSARTFNIYNFSGKLVRQKATSLEGLPRGIYIVNRKKIFVK